MKSSSYTYFIFRIKSTLDFFFFLSLLGFTGKVLSFIQFFYEVHIKKVNGEELGGEGEDTGGTLVWY